MPDDGGQGNDEVAEVLQQAVVGEESTVVAVEQSPCAAQLATVVS